MKKPFPLLLTFLLVKSVLVLYFIHTGTVGLGPDEAQYWTWSRQLDWGYYSKPPGIAWQIRLGTLFWGNTELGVRFMAVVLGFLIPVAVYFLARACRLKHWTAFWAGAVMAFSPMGILSSILATTDGGLVLFWTLSSLVVVHALSRGIAPNYYLLGALILFGALFKWPIYLFWIFVLLGAAVFRELRSIHVLGGMAVSLLGLLPSVAWNAQHDWATFRHVLATMAGGHGQETGTTPLMKGNLLEFLGAQASLLSPILFVLLVMALVSMLKNPKKVWPPLIFCGGVTLLLLVSYSFAALFQKMQGNWCVFAYPTAIILLAWFCCERVSWGRVWLIGGIALSVILSSLLLSIPYLQSEGLVDLPYKYNPFRHNVGWKRLGRELEALGYDPDSHFLFSDKYQMTSLLSFYAPGQQRAYFFNLQGARKNQFSYWPDMGDEQQGKTGFFVLAENQPHLRRLLDEKIDDYNSQLASYFKEVEYLGVWPVFYNGPRLVKGAIVYKCFIYSGKEPSGKELY